MTIDIVAEQGEFEEHFLCYDPSGQYVFHTYLEKEGSRWISVSRFSLITAERLQYARLRNCVMEILSVMPVLPSKRKGTFLALYLVYQSFRDAFGGIFRDEILKSRQLMVAHLEEKSHKKLKLPPDFELLVWESRFMLVNLNLGIVKEWTLKDLLPVAKFLPVSKDELRLNLAPVAVDLAEMRLTLYSYTTGVLKFRQIESLLYGDLTSTIPVR